MAIYQVSGSPHTVTPPSNVTAVSFILRSGGGSGAKGGGAGGSCVMGTIPHLSGDVYTIQVPQGGVGQCGGDHGGTASISSEQRGLIASAVGGDGAAGDAGGNNAAQLQSCYVHSDCTNVQKYEGGHGGARYWDGSNISMRGGGGGGAASPGGHGTSAPMSGPDPAGNGGKGGVAGMVWDDPPMPGGWLGGGGGGDQEYDNQGAPGGDGACQTVYQYPN